MCVCVCVCELNTDLDFNLIDTTIYHKMNASSKSVLNVLVHQDLFLSSSRVVVRLCHVTGGWMDGWMDDLHTESLI